MTLMTICTNVALDCGVDLPSGAIFGNRAPVAQRLLAQASRAAVSVAKKANWAALTVQYTFTAQPGVSDYPLPADYDRLVGDTMWERSRYWALRGSMSPQRWQLYKSSLWGRASIERRWRIRVPSASGQGLPAGTPPTFSLDPLVGATDSTSRFVFEYVSKNWCMAADGTMQPAWGGDNDTTIIDENLVELGTRWRALRRIGLAYEEEQDEYQRELDQAIARDGGNATLELVPSDRNIMIGPYNVPDTGFGP